MTHVYIETIILISLQSYKNAFFNNEHINISRISNNNVSGGTDFQYFRGRDLMSNVSKYFALTY